VDTTSRISNKEKSNRLAYAEGFGIAMRLRTPSGLALVENPVVDMIHHYVERKQYEEELRVLYVALTRARERLFVYGTCPLAKREDYENKISVLREDLSSYSVRTLASMMEIILVAGDISTREEKLDDIHAVRAVNADCEEDCIERVEPEYEVSELSDELARRFTYEYHSRYLTELPEKMSVSLMSPYVLDGTDAESVRPLERDEDVGRSILPAFADGGMADESAKRGIATHYFMQFCDFDRLARDGAEAELSRLVASEYLSKADGERVRLNEIDAFRRSALFDEMRRARNIYREFRFNVRLPAESFTSEEERARALKGRDVLVQGVIDCIVERDDGTLCL